MILQTDPALPEEINDFGCYFCSCLFEAEKRTGKSFDADEVLSVFRAAKQTGILGAECFVNDPVSLLELVGVRVQSVVKADNGSKPMPGGFELLHFHRDSDTPAGMGNAAHDHFV